MKYPKMASIARNRKLSLFMLAFTIGIVIILFVSFLNASPAYASGVIQVSSYNEFLDIQFVSSTTNDQGWSIDPGQDVHVGQCISAFEGKRATLTVYNGYPNYQCTFTLRLKNMGEQPVHIQRVNPNVPGELSITQPDSLDGLVLNPLEEVSLEFSLKLNQNVAENTKYHFSIQLIFEDFNG